jgi:hypothetical protein
LHREIGFTHIHSLLKAFFYARCEVVRLLTTSLDLKSTARSPTQGLKLEPGLIIAIQSTNINQLDKLYIRLEKEIGG